MSDHDRCSQHGWLHSQRRAYAAMSSPRKVLHRVLWSLYRPVARYAVFRRLWGAYRRTWPA